MTTKTFLMVSADQEKVKKNRETDMEMLEMKEYPGETEPSK